MSTSVLKALPGKLDIKYSLFIDRGRSYLVLITHGVRITAKVSEYRYDLRVKSQGQIYFKFILQLTTQTPLSCFDGGCSYLAQFAYRV